MQIVEGRHYQDRSGRLWGPMVRHPNIKNLFHEVNSPGTSWVESGRYRLGAESPIDLVKEVLVAPAVLGRDPAEGLIVEADGFYRMRRGNIVGPLSQDDNVFTDAPSGLSWFKDGKFVTTRKGGEAHQFDLMYPICIFKQPEGEAEYPLETDADGYLFEFANQAGRSVWEDNDGDYTMFPNNGLADMLKVMGAGKDWKQRTQDIANDLSRINDDMPVTFSVFMGGKPFANIHAIESIDLDGVKHTPKLIPGEGVPVSFIKFADMFKMDMPKLDEFQRKLIAEISRMYGVPYHMLAGRDPSRYHVGGYVGNPLGRGTILLGKEKVMADADKIVADIIRHKGKLRSIEEWEKFLASKPFANMTAGLSRVKDMIRDLADTVIDAKMAPDSKAAIERWRECIVQLETGRLVGTFDKRTGKRCGYDKHEFPIVGSLWTNIQGVQYEVVRINPRGSSETIDGRPGKSSEVSVSFKHYPADKRAAEFFMDLSRWALRMIYVRDPIPTSATLVWQGNPDIPKRVYWDRHRAKFVRKSASGKTEYFMSDEFHIAWGSEHHKFPAYPHSKTVKVKVDADNPETIKVPPMRLVFNGLTSELLSRKLGKLTEEKAALDAANAMKYGVTVKFRKEDLASFKGAVETPATKPLNVYYDPDGKGFWQVENGAVKKLDASFNLKWHARKDEFHIVKISRGTPTHEELLDAAVQRAGESLGMSESMIEFQKKAARQLLSPKLIKEELNAVYGKISQEELKNQLLGPKLAEVSNLELGEPYMPIPSNVYWSLEDQQFFTRNGEMLNAEFHAFWTKYAKRFPVYEYDAKAKGKVIPDPTPIVFKPSNTDEILKLIVSYLHDEDKQSKAVRRLLKRVRDLGLTL